jgi:hypothetical protein
MATPTHHYPMTRAYVSPTQVSDIIGTAHLLPGTGQAIHYSEGQVKGLSNRGFLTNNFRGLAGGTDLGESGLTTTLPDASVSMSLLIRVHGAAGNTIARFLGTGGRYLTLYGAGDICLNASLTYRLIPVTGYAYGTWYRLTLVRVGTTTQIWLDGTKLDDCTAMAFAMPLGAFNLFGYNVGATTDYPAPVEVSDLWLYSDALEQADVDALCAADGNNPASYSCLNLGSSFGGHVPSLEIEYLTPAGNTYNELATIASTPMIKYTTNGNACREGRQVGVPGLTEANFYGEFYIPAGCAYNEDGTSPGPGYMLLMAQRSVNLSATGADYIFSVECQHTEGAINRWKVTWYNAAGTGTVVNMTGAGTAIPTNRAFKVRAYVKYADAASIIQVWIDGVQVADISNANFTSKSPIKVAGFGLWQGTHIEAFDADTAPNNYFAIGKSYVGQTEYIENISSHKRRLKAAMKFIAA